MKKGITRDIVSLVLLSLFTCGIYTLYWYYTATKEIDEANGEVSNAGVELLLIIVTCGVYAIYWFYKYAEEIEKLAKRYGIKTDDNLPILSLILCLVGGSVISMVLMQSNMNRIWKFVVNG